MYIHVYIVRDIDINIEIIYIQNLKLLANSYSMVSNVLFNNFNGRNHDES